MLLNLDEIEKTVGLPVFTSFPCDYADVTEAIRAGRPAATLATSVQKFARMVLDRQMTADKPRRFIERFGLVPLRYGFR